MDVSIIRQTKLEGIWSMSSKNKNNSCGSPAWKDSTSEEFWREAKNNSEYIAKQMKSFIDDVSKNKNSDEKIWYEVSPASKGLESVIFWLKKSENSVFCLNSEGVLRIYCKGETNRHYMHRKLLKKIQEKRLFNQEPNEDKAWFQINFDKHLKDIEKLRLLYIQAMQN